MTGVLDTAPSIGTDDTVLACWPSRRGGGTRFTGRDGKEFGRSAARSGDGEAGIEDLVSSEASWFAQADTKLTRESPGEAPASMTTTRSVSDCWSSDVAVVVLLRLCLREEENENFDLSVLEDGLGDGLGGADGPAELKENRERKERILAGSVLLSFCAVFRPKSGTVGDSREEEVDGRPAERMAGCFFEPEGRCDAPKDS